MMEEPYVQRFGEGTFLVKYSEVGRNVVIVSVIITSTYGALTICQTLC